MLLRLYFLQRQNIYSNTITRTCNFNEDVKWTFLNASGPILFLLLEIMPLCLFNFLELELWSYFKLYYELMFAVNV